MIKKVYTYLAGGFRSGWQDAVEHAINTELEYRGYRRSNRGLILAKNGSEEIEIDPVFIDPRSHGLKEEFAYTRWDIIGIIGSDIVFAYIEKDNPSIGLAFEIGFASALEKTTILVDQSPEETKRYFGMVRSASSVVYNDFDQAIRVLSEFIILKGLLS